jgi:LysM repeat protein
MEEENPKKRNVRPEETSQLPLITLVVLLLIIVGLFYIGYEYVADNASGSETLTNTVADTTNKEADPARPLPADEKLPEPEVIINYTDDTTTSTTPVAPTPSTETTSTPPTAKKANLGGTTISHTVQSGETFYGIANRYNLTWQTLQSANPSIKDFKTDLKTGVTTLTVPVQAIHTVGAGDVLRVVASKYGISKQLLMQANKKDRDYAKRGEKLTIPFAEKK